MFFNQAAFSQLLNEDGGLSAPTAPATIVNGGDIPYPIVVSDFERSMNFYNALLEYGPESGNMENYVSNPGILTVYNVVEAGGFKNATYSLPDSDMNLELMGWDGVTMPPPTNDRIYDAGSTALVLFVKDLNVAIEAVLNNGGSYLTESGVINSNPELITTVVTDPDGFYIELIQLQEAPNTSIPGNTIHGRFKVSVTDIEDTVEFYSEVFGMEFGPVGDYFINPARGEVTGLGDLRMRQAFSVLPGSNVNFELIEYDVEDKVRVSYRLPAVGSPRIRILIADPDDLVDTLAKARYAGARLPGNYEVPAVVGGPVTMMAIEDPNGAILELASGFPLPE